MSGINNSNDVFARGVLVQLSTSIWGAKVKLAANHLEGCDPKFVTAHKSLIDKDYLRELESIRNGSRSYLEAKSLPFPLSGVLFLPKGSIEEVHNTLIAQKEKFTLKVNEFSENYPLYREAAREKLGDLFNESDYPTDITTKFNFEWQFFIMEAPGKHGVLSPELYAQAESRFRQTIASFQETAMMTLRESFAELVGHMVERLSDPTKKFKDTLVGNIRVFMDDFNNLNITDDSALQELVERAKGVLSGEITAQDLRDDTSLRQNVAKQMENVQSIILNSLVDRPGRKLRMAA